jgi:hypothetical protein
MHHVVVQVLGTVKQVPDQPAVFSHFCADSVIYRANRGQAMNIGANAAGALRKKVCVPGVPSLEHYFNPAKKGRTAPCIRYLSALHFHFYLEMTFDPGDRINYHSCHDDFSLFKNESVSFGHQNIPIDQDDL